MPSGFDLQGPNDTLRSVGLGFLAGILVGAVLMTALPGPAGGPSETGPDPADPPYTTARAGPTCVDGGANPEAGWVHEVAVGDAYAVTLNATVVHDAGTELRASVVPRRGGAYELALGTASVTPERSVECPRVRTDFEMAVSLPTSYRELRVTLNGRTLVRATRDDTTADLYPLPNPVDASA